MLAHQPSLKLAQTGTKQQAVLRDMWQCKLRGTWMLLASRRMMPSFTLTVPVSLTFVPGGSCLASSAGQGLNSIARQVVLPSVSLSCNSLFAAALCSLAEYSQCDIAHQNAYDGSLTSTGCNSMFTTADIAAHLAHSWLAAAAAATADDGVLRQHICRDVVSGMLHCAPASQE